MLVEHARNVMGIQDAVHAEYGHEGTPIVTALACSLADSQITVDIKPDTLLAGVHGSGRRSERTHCNYGLEPTMAHLAANGGLVVAAVDDTGEVRAVERPDHPFFVGTLYQPQLTSSAQAPHQLLCAFLTAALGR